MACQNCKNVIEQSNLCMDVVISKIKELFPDRKLFSDDPMKSSPVSLIIMCKAQKFANDKLDVSPEVLDAQS